MVSITALQGHEFLEFPGEVVVQLAVVPAPGIEFCEQPRFAGVGDDVTEVDLEERLRVDRGDVFVELSIDAGEGQVTKSSEKGKLDGVFRAFAGWLPDEQAEAVIRC